MTIFYDLNVAPEIEVIEQLEEFGFNGVDLIMANGGDSKINRAICEMPQIDIINHPYLNNRNSGINHVLAKLLVKNNISVNINLMDILKNRGYYKARILNQTMNMDLKHAKNTISKNPLEIIKNITKHKNSIIDGVQIIE